MGGSARLSRHLERSVRIVYGLSQARDAGVGAPRDAVAQVRPLEVRGDDVEELVAVARWTQHEARHDREHDSARETAARDIHRDDGQYQDERGSPIPAPVLTHSAASNATACATANQRFLWR